jgi:hypothetical protein
MLRLPQIPRPLSLVSGIKREVRLHRGDESVRRLVDTGQLDRKPPVILNQCQQALEQPPFFDGEFL